MGDVKEPLRPDLAIEVVWTSGGVSKLEIYRRLQVREVWYWQDERVTIYTLRREAGREDRYEVAAESEVLAGIELAVLLPFLDVTPMTRAVRAYRDALRA